MRPVLCLLSVAMTLPAGVPTIDDLLNLKTARGAVISPDGRYIIYGVSETDWEQDTYLTHLWLAETGSGRTWQLTRGKKSESSPVWSPDSKWLAFTRNEGTGSQIFALRPDGGESVQLSKTETSVGSFQWSPDGKWIAYTAADKRPEARKKHLGDYEVVRRDYAYSHIWTFDVSEALKAPVAGTQRTRGTDYTVGGIAWSPDGKKIAFSAQRNPDLVQSSTADIYVLTLDGNGVQKVVGQPGVDNGPVWSPDGKFIAFSSAMGQVKLPDLRRIAVVGADGGVVRSLTDGFDESPSIEDWKADGIYFTALQKTEGHAYRLDPATSKITRLSATPSVNDFTLSKDGTMAGISISSASQLNEIYVTPVAGWAPRRLTEMTAAVKDWTLPVSEVISWKSRDGEVIEGVLTRSANFDATKKHPLLCVIHGGPTGIDLPQKVSGTRYYPTDLWAARDALVLRVNYRGSTGYGKKFLQLNVRNLGVGDAWDVESGVDHLIAKGWVDEKKVGVMGWSQGGYISAFLSANSKKFAAISVGAGISNWSTYYYNTDITTFTLRYLGDNPANDPAIYQKTSPMTNIKMASTPTLIQHGELDKRVPIANGYELRQGLEDRGVPVEMIVYKGFGHGITKPKSMRAVMQHNLAWFNHYIFGDTAPDFVTPPVPAEKETK
ncbi:MAG: S9 family peptidase [Acidobacteria bacterium]|nr:S9 family peptidase [Acidobacteriota bacterium]